MTAVDVGNETALSFGTRDPRSPRLRPDGYEGKFVAATRKQVCQKRRKESNKLQGWTYILNDAGLPDHLMAPVYPLGLNVLLARVGGTVYAVSGKWAHMACPLSAGRLEGSTIVCSCRLRGSDGKISRCGVSQNPKLIVHAFTRKAVVVEEPRRCKGEITTRCSPPSS